MHHKTGRKQDITRLGIRVGWRAAELVSDLRPRRKLRAYCHIQLHREEYGQSIVRVTHENVERLFQSNLVPAGWNGQVVLVTVEIILQRLLQRNPLLILCSGFED